MERLGQKAPKEERASAAPPSVAYLLARLALSAVGAGFGYQVAEWMLRRGLLSDAINRSYLTLLGLLIGYLVSPSLARRGERLWRQLAQLTRRVPPQAVLAAIVGVTVALVITVLLNTLLTGVPGFTWYWSLLLTLMLVTASAWFFVINRQLFTPFGANLTAQAPTLSRGDLKLVDTSAIIDGRIAEVAEANFLDGKLLIPRFVLHELQNIADSSDPLRRNRGRRGLEVLDRLVAQKKVEVEIVSDEVEDADKVDEKLIRLCQTRQAALLTTDYNLNRVAALQNVRVLNVNGLANALRAMFLPGERLSLYIAKEGREPGQGLAYLDDGTMVVVEDAQQAVASTLDVVVTSNLQTNMGRMIFARPYRAGD